ncbi:MAG: (d)CMP kinase [Microthrixaceae bacterium]|nr:(d)CMP kinase [Microthrixaceae bacterium]
MKYVRVIAIDGPAGSGKSTIGRALAERLGLTYLDTGAMYRAVAFVALTGDIDVSNDDLVGTAARSMALSLDGGTVTVNGVDATQEIRGPQVSAAVSTVAALPAVREEMRVRQRSWAEAHGGGVIEGRDIGSVVFPDAVLKVYLTASEAERAARRAKQLGDSDTDAVAAAIAKRDAADSSRRDSPLVEPDGAVTVDSTGMGIDEVVDVIVGLLESR